MAEWFVGPIMEKVMNSCSEYLEDQFRWQTGMKKELERLRANHPKIQAIVFAARQVQIRDQNPALNKWMWQLREAIDEADDVLDEFEYMKHKEQLSKNMEETKVRSATTSFLFENARKLRKVGERALKIDPNLKRLEEVVQKLDKVSAEVGTFLHLLESTKQVQHEQQLELYKIRETGSLPKNDLIGRGEDKEFVMQWLRQPSNQEHQTEITSTTLYTNISLLSIVAHGGMGKTTLLQHVYEDHDLTTKFDLKMWVCVSNNFDAKKVIADILESLKKKKPDLESLDALQESLKSEVMSKKFLLVLDDIWEEGEERDKSKWENVLAPLAYGGLGSKILITTRMNSIALTIAKVIRKKKEIFRLKGLKEDECLQLLNTHAFADVENLDDHKKLKSIARDVVKKLSGSPLAAKIIGGILNSKLDERHWNTVLNNAFKSAEFGQNDILPILKLSYIYLPKPLQNCFSFCCMFPQNYTFGEDDKDDLIRMWIAVGFIQPPPNLGETMEDIGRRYFDVLVKKSFFDKSEHGTYYKMHDLLYELAQSISAEECFRVMSDELFFKIPKTIRHLCVKTRNLEILKKVIQFKNLCSLYLTYEKDDQDFVEVLAKIFEASKSLRLLHIDAPQLKVIPEAIGCLIHLRYLKISTRHVDLLPRSLSNLYHLEFIICDDFVGSLSDNFLPKDMNNLFNLRYLKLPHNLIHGIHGVGKLTSLQKLYDYCVKNENGYRIGELEHMNGLRLLGIKYLENVEEATEACNAKLCDKRNLTDLFLDWGHSFDFLYHIKLNYIFMPEKRSRQKLADPDLDERVLNNLKPYNTLRKLRITEYMGVRSAIWMNNGDLLYNLEYVKLNECLEWQTLPPFGQLPFLKFLCLYKMPKVQRLDNKFHGNDKCCVFPSLEVLHIEGLEALEEWFEAGISAEDDCLFPRLTTLSLRKCPNLQELPYLPPKLEMLKIQNIGWKTLNCCSISKAIPLETLLVVDCPNMTYIHLADEIARLAALRDLTILHCPNLISLGGHQQVETTQKCRLILNKLTINDPSVLPMEPLRSFASIQNLKIMDNDELVSFSIEAEQWFSQGSSSLFELYFSNLKSLQSLPFSLESFSSLKSLNVDSVPKLQLLPNIPISLEKLNLRRLVSLGRLPSCLSSLSSLTNISIHDVPQLRELPDFPPSLKCLSIIHCHSELKERYERFSGPYWHKIAYIPHIYIISKQDQ